jgi:hypothetical protein
LEFSERGADAIVDGEVGGEFVVAAAQVLHESVSGGDGTQRADRSQSARRDRTLEARRVRTMLIFAGTQRVHKRTETDRL